MKEFFKPIKGGYQDGLTFTKFLFTWDRLGVLCLPIAFLVLILLHRNEYGVEPVFIYTLSGLMAFVFILILWKGIIQHWLDLKNHTSR